MTAETENLTIIPRRHFGRIIGAAVVCLALAAIARAFAVGQIEWNYVAEFLTVPAIMTGLVNTIVMAILAMLLGITLGVVFAVMRLSANPVLSKTAIGYIWFFRAVPALLQLLGEGATSRVGGQVTWNGTASRPSTNAPWQLSFDSNLAGLESDLPEPFDKAKGRALPISGELRFDADGVREFVVDGKDFAIRGDVQAGALHARFDPFAALHLEAFDDPGAADRQLSFGCRDPKLLFHCIHAGHVR